MKVGILQWKFRSLWRIIKARTTFHQSVEIDSCTAPPIPVCSACLSSFRATRNCMTTIGYI